MKYSKIIFVFLMAFVASCSNKRQPSDNYPNDYSEYQVTKEHVEPDTIKKAFPHQNHQTYKVLHLHIVKRRN